TSRFMLAPKRTAVTDRLPLPSTSVRGSRMIGALRDAGWASFVEGVERKLKRAADCLFLLAGALFVADQLAHHFPATGEFLRSGVEIVGHARVVAKLEIGESVATLERQGLWINGKRVSAFADECRPDHRAIEMLFLPHREHRAANLFEVVHPRDVDRLLDELALVDVFQQDLQRAIVFDRHQRRAMTARFAPPQWLRAAGVGDQLRGPRIVIVT